MSHAFKPLLGADRLGYSLPDGRTLFSELTVGFGRERTGLVGPNGIGKSTLARILVGELRPTHGAVLRGGRIGYLPQRRVPPAGPPPHTLADLLGIAHTIAALDRILAGSTDPADYDAVGDRWDVRERVAAVLQRFGLARLELDRPADALSGGERTRAALAGLLLEAPDFLVLDEPTNDLDTDGRHALYRFVEEWAGGLLVITHDRALLGRVDRIVELSGLGVRVYGGNWEVYAAQRAVEEDAAARELAHARTELQRTRRAAQQARERQERRASQGQKDAAKANMPKILLGGQKRRSEATAARLRRIHERRVDEAREKVAAARARVEERARLRLELPSTGLPAGKRVVVAEHVTFAYPGAAAPVVAGLSLLITGPERVAVTGRNGAGKTTLLRLLAGELSPDAGAIRLGVPPEAVAYLDQAVTRLDAGRSILDSFRAANPSLEPSATRYALARFGFRGDAALALVGSLSGGERLRAALACVLNAARPPQLLLLDEPTNHLDLDSLAAVEAALAGYDGALVVTSHDETFLEAIGIERVVAVGGD